MRLTTADASFLYTESASGPMHISSVYILEGELAFERVWNIFSRACIWFRRTAANSRKCR